MAKPMLDVGSYRYYDVHGYWARFAWTVTGQTMTIFMHREVMSEHLGRPLASYEIVHHKDGDKKNNALANLELMTAAAHAKHHGVGVEFTAVCCAECGKPVEKRAREVRAHYKKQRDGLFCGRSCAGKANQRKQGTMQGGRGGRPRKNVWTDEEAAAQRLAGRSVAEIARVLGASRSAVQDALVRQKIGLPA